MARVTTEVDIDIELDEFEDDELIDEMKSRGFTVLDEDDEVSNEDGFFLPNLFDRHQLRKHLLNITGLGSYVTDEDILSELKSLLK